MNKPAIKAILVLLLACVLPAAPAFARQPAAALPADTKGYVVVVIPRVLGKQMPTVTLQAVPGKGELFTLKPLASNNEVMAGWVPPGSYEIEEMVRTSRSKYVPVEVKAGTVTELGGMTWASVGDDESRFMPIRHQDFVPVIEAALEPVKAAVAGERIVWNPGAPPVGRDIPNGPKLPAPVLAQLAAHEAAQKSVPLRQQLRLANSLAEFSKLYVAASAPLLGDASTARDGTLYVGANFGQLRKRATDGRWSAIDTGTISPIVAVEAAASPIIAGTHDGLLLAGGGDGQPWKRLHHFGRQEMVLAIHFTGTQYLVLTGRLVNESAWNTPSVDSLQVYGIDAPALAAPKLIRKIALPKTYTMQRAGAYQATLAGKYYMVNTFDAIERFDLAAGSWKTVSPAHEVSVLRSANNGALITAFKAQGGFSKLSTSHDGGETWAPFERPSYPVIDIRMESPESGFASRVDMGAFSSALQLTQYDPASKSWKAVLTAPKSTCARTIRDGRGREQFCVTPRGSIFRFGDGVLIPEFAAD